MYPTLPAWRTLGSVSADRFPLSRVTWRFRDSKKRRFRQFLFFFVDDDAVCERDGLVLLLACSANGLPCVSLFLTSYWCLRCCSRRFFLNVRGGAVTTSNPVDKSSRVFIFIFLFWRTIFWKAQKMVDGRLWFVSHSYAVLPQDETQTGLEGGTASSAPVIERSSWPWNVGFSNFTWLDYLFVVIFRLLALWFVLLFSVTR